MKLIIAEKYKVAQSFAKLLGCTKRNITNNNGSVGYVESPDGEWCITWAAGHVIRTLEPDEYSDDYKRWSFDTLPIIPTVWKYKPSDVNPAKSQWKVLRELVNREDITAIYHAADADREGEMIGREILREAHAPASKEYFRLWYTNTTDAALRRAISEAKPLKDYRPLGEAADCRQKLDWIYGFNMTRAYTLYAHSVQNVGRVVSPTINLIVQRQKEIDDFVPENYAVVTASIKSEKGEFTADAKFEDIEYAGNLSKTIKGKTATVSKIEKTTENENRKLYNTTQLQADASKRFGYEPDMTMKVLQELYDAGYISYPRTKSNNINADQVEETKDLPKLAWEKVFKSPEMVSPDVFDINRLVVAKGKSAEEASHTGLCPTDVGINEYQKSIKCTDSADEMSKRKRNIFLLISMRLICAVMPPRVLDKTKIDIAIEKDMFKATGSVEVSPGFSAFEKYVLSFIKQKKQRKQASSDQLLPDLAEGEQLNCTGGKCSKKTTKPPKQYTTAQLLTTMENISRIVDDKKMKELLKDSGLGTAASRDTIIKTIKNNGFVTTEGGMLYPTQKAIKLMSLLPEDMKSPIMTGQMEIELDAIARGEGSAQEFIESVKERVQKEVDAVKALPPIPDTDRYKDNKVFLKDACPKCGQDVVETDKMMVCKHNCGFKLWRTVAKKKIPKGELKALLETGMTTAKLEGFKSKAGKDFSCWLYIDPEDGLNVKFDFDDNGKNAKNNFVAKSKQAG